MGHGSGRTEVSCDDITPYSISLCESVKEVVASEIDIETKRLADFLLYILAGQRRLPCGTSLTD